MEGVLGGAFNTTEKKKKKKNVYVPVNEESH